jgi:hypothetical protein
MKVQVTTTKTITEELRPDTILRELVLDMFRDGEDICKVTVEWFEGATITFNRSGRG